MYGKDRRSDPQGPSSTFRVRGKSLSGDEFPANRNGPPKYSRSAEDKTRKAYALKAIEKAGDLYREIKSRGLHLREDNGRDNALLQELAGKIGCPDARLQRFLDASDLSAEAFLRVFLELAAPFARMFKEIWDYLSAEASPKATETISVRFGFQDSKDQCDIDLEQFRRYVETSQRVIAEVTTRLWPYKALNGLFSVGAKLTDGNQVPMSRCDEYARYEPGKPYALPIVSCTGHPFDQVVKDVRSVFQYIIDGYAQERSQKEPAKQLPELRQDVDVNHEVSLATATRVSSDGLTAYLEPHLSQMRRVSAARKECGATGVRTGRETISEHRNRHR